MTPEEDLYLNFIVEPDGPSTLSNVCLGSDPGSLGLSVLSHTSAVFRPDAGLSPLLPDAILKSSDHIDFYVHTSILRSVSINHFNRLFLTEPLLFSKEGTPRLPLTVDTPSDVLDIVLRIIYSLEFDVMNLPSFATISSVMDTLPKYGLDPKAYAVSPQPFYSLLVTYAADHAMPLYCLAGAHDLFEIAVAASAHLLSYPLAQVTDNIAARMGGKYLRKLYFLHLGRVDALKRLLLTPPTAHAPGELCDATKQKELERTWALACAYLAWDSRPDITSTVIWETFASLANQLPCDLCKIAWNDRVTALINQWNEVPSTIL